MKFLKANIYRRYNHFDKAIPLFDGHPRQAPRARDRRVLGEPPARLRTTALQKYDEMLALADKLDKDPKFLEGKDDLDGDARRRSRRSRCARRPRSSRRTRRRRRTSRKYVAVRPGLPRHLQREPGSQGERRGPLQRRRLLRGGQLDRRRDPDVQRCCRSTTRTSKLTAKALARLGKAYGDIAFYDKAAEKLEEYAKKYAGEKDAYDAMSDAVFYRKGIGDDAKAIENTKYFIKTFGAKKPAGGRERDVLADLGLREAGRQGRGHQAPARLHPQYGDEGRRGPPRHRARQDRPDPVGAELPGEAGRRLVREDRPRARDRHQEARRSKRQGGQRSADAVRPRVEDQADRRQARRAQAARRRCRRSRAAAKEFEKVSGKTGGDDGGARYYYAHRQGRRGRRRLRGVPRLKFPQNLNFDHGSRSKKAIEEKSAQAVQRVVRAARRRSAAARRQEVRGRARRSRTPRTRSPRPRASARSRRTSPTQLFTAEIPKDVRSRIDGYADEDKVDAYCDALTDGRRAARRRSRSTRTACASRSRPSSAGSASGRSCASASSARSSRKTSRRRPSSAATRPGRAGHRGRARPSKLD